VSYALDMRQVILRPGEDGMWVAEVPSLPGCFSQGKTREEAVANARDAIDAWIDAARGEGVTVPDDAFDVVVCVV
jgi:predicted RNase H-like HicB family nuclease